MADKKVEKITLQNIYNNPQLEKIKKDEDTFNSVFSEEQLEQYEREERNLLAQLKQGGGGPAAAQQLQKVKQEIATIKKQLENEENGFATQLQSDDEIEKQEALKKEKSLEIASQMTPQEAKRRSVAQEAFAKKQNNFLNLSDEEQEVLENDTINTLEMLLDNGKQTLKEQDKEDGWIAKLANKVREFFGGKNTKENVELQFQEQEKFINSLKQADTPEEFSRLYKENTGVEFDPEKIQKFQEAKNYSTIANAGLAKCSELQEALKRETFTGQDLINATRKFYGCSQEEAIAKLNEYAKNEKGGRYTFDQNGNLSVKTTVFSLKGETEVTKTYKPNEVGSEIKSHKEGDIISQAYNGFKDYATYCTEQYQQNFEKTIGKSIKEVSEDYTKYSKEALGTSGFNGELVSKYCEKQETVADRVSAGVSIAGMAMMVGGYVAAPATGGASIAVAQVGTGMALGGQFLDEGLDLADELTSENGLSKEEGLALLKETATDAALVSSGFAINKVSSGVNQLVLSKMGSKVVAKAAEVGVDASLGIYADYIITGDVNLTGEGISQGISIITGISMGKMASANVKTAPARNTQPDFQRISPNSNDFEIDGTVIKNPKKTQTQAPTIKNVSDMSIIEKTALGIDEATTSKKIILSDSAEARKPLILGEETPKNQRIILDNEPSDDITRSFTHNGYVEEQYKYMDAKGSVKKEVQYDSQENTFKTTETKTHSKNWEIKDKDVTVTDTKYTPEGVLKSRTNNSEYKILYNRPATQGSADSATIKKIDDLMEYNENIRKKPSKISLDRNPIYDCDIPYQPDSYYRVIGEDGWNDFNQSKTLRPKQVSKENYQVAYFEKGRANSIYARSEASQAYIAETNSSMIKVDKQHYPYANEIPSDEPIRIWHKTQNGYEIVYDTMNDIVSKNNLRYGKTAAQEPVSPEISAKLKNFNVSDTDYSLTVQKYGAEQATQNIELLSQLKSLNIFKDSDLTLEDVPRIYGVIKSYAENTLETDFKPEHLLSSKELKIDANSDARLDIEITRDVDFDTIQKIYKSLNPNYKRAIDSKYLTNIGNKKNIVCMESDIANAKSINPANQQKFVDSLVESNMITDKLVAAYDNMLKSNDILAKEIATRVNEKPLILTDNAGMETKVYFKDLYNKAKANPESLTPSEIHGLTDIFKNEVRLNKASMEFFDSFMDAEIKVKGELKPEYKQIAGAIDAMKNSSASVLKGSDIEIGEHAFMRLIDRDLINPTNKNGEIVNFKTLVETAKTEISKRDAKDSLKNIVLSELYSSEGKPISLIVKRVNGKIMIESFM